MGLMKDGQPRWPVIAVAVTGALIGAAGEHWHLQNLDFIGFLIAVAAVWELL